MIDLTTLLDRLDAEEELEPPADAATITTLAPRFKELFGINPPDALQYL